MTEYSWGKNHQAMLVCVDSYDSGVLQGRIYASGQEGQHFDSLSQFLLRTERLLEESGTPQSFTTPRSFAMPKTLRDAPAETSELNRGTAATFDLRVLFRQHASWQGELLWLEGGAQQSFRSVLELITLMDSALRSEKQA